MGKKLIVVASNERVLTMKEHLRHASNALQRHIFHKNSLKIKQFLDQKMKNYQISFQTHDKYMDIIRQTKLETKNRQEKALKEDSQEKDPEQEKIQIHKQVSLQNEFEAMLEKSLPSYEKSYDLFKKGSLLQKYGHLIGISQKQQEDAKVEELTEQEQWALKKIKILYRKYKVSNMYKMNILSRVRKPFIQKLVEKGYLRQKNQIISLTS